MWHYIIPPLIGAVIGYCTNYIAVKMLFRPRNEIKVLGHTLPFTPGAIPKNKPRLAKAIGEVVETTFFGEETISAQFLSGEGPPYFRSGYQCSGFRREIRERAGSAE